MVSVGSVPCRPVGSYVPCKLEEHYEDGPSFQGFTLKQTFWPCSDILTANVLVERHVAAVYVMIVNCWTSHGRRTFDDNVSIRLC